LITTHNDGNPGGASLLTQSGGGASVCNPKNSCHGGADFCGYSQNGKGEQKRAAFLKNPEYNGRPSPVRKFQLPGAS
jgi:hypothetical protein